MNSFVQLVTKRNVGRVRASFISYWDETLPEVLARFGLGCEEFPDPRLRQVRRAEAHTILVSLLRQDMAYHLEILSQDDAESLADHFLQCFPSDDTRFLTNLEKPEDPGRPFDVGSSPMTGATFDAGIICIAKPLAGCLWVEDED